MLIGYARVSTIDQNLDLQIDALKQAGCDKIFQDEGVSGAKASRPGLEKLLKRLKQGDVLIVWKLDRLGRSLSHLIDLISHFEDRGVGFTSLSDGIDTTTPIGKLFFHISGAFGEYERNLISERTKAGMAAAKARGVRLGRPPKHDLIQEKTIGEFDATLLDAEAARYGLEPPVDDEEKTTMQ